MDIVHNFDPEKYYLGKLCKRKHDYQDLSKSIRLRSCRTCFYCKKEDLIEWRRINPDRVKADNQKRSQAKAEWHRNDYSSNPEKYKQRGREWRDKNPDAVLAIAKRYRRRHPEKIKLARASYYAANRDRILSASKKSKAKRTSEISAYNKKYRLRNLERIAAKAKVWDENNKERRRFLSRRWRENNPEKVAEQHNRRRLAKHQNHKFPYSKSDLQRRWDELDGCCAYCQKILTWGEVGTYQLDHFIAICHGGPDNLSNLVYACTNCNRSKNSCDPKDWYTKQPFYNIRRWEQMLRALGKPGRLYNQLSLF